jgi:hypothetical protein
MNLTVRNIVKTVASTLILAVSAGTVSAGHLSDIDDHARDIEREAERAERVVLENFRNAPAPIIACLSEHLCAIAKIADRVDNLCSCEANLDTVNALTCQMNTEFREAERGFAELRHWASVCHASPSGHCHSCSACRVNEYHLKRLCERIDAVRDELRCMTGEVTQLVAVRDAALLGHRHHVSRVAPVIAPPPVFVNRPIAPACNTGSGLTISIGRGGVSLNSSRFGFGSDTHRDSRFGQSDHRSSFRGRDVHDSHNARTVSSRSSSIGSRSRGGVSFSFGR